MPIADKQQSIQHLFWRAGFGATPAVIQRESHRPIRKVVHDLLHSHEAFAPLAVVDGESPVDRPVLRKLVREGTVDRVMLRQKIKDDTEHLRDLNGLWIERMASGQDALREKMALFWHGHFACRVRNPVAMQHYLNTIRQHALGRFGDLLMGVSKEPAMLQFLNNQQNRKNAPNENFAREVMELFTLGRGNYTESDIKQAARAFTGWGFSPDGQFLFRENQHDDGPKTIFGETGNFVGEDVIRLLLAKKPTARFVTEKLYRFLVDDQAGNLATNPRIDALADRFYSSGYDISDLLETILTADWFYEPAYIGNRIKSPVELLAGMQHTLSITFEQKQSVMFIQRTLGQVLLYPPNVAGWPGGRNWIDSSSLLFRMQLPNILLQAGQVNIKPKEDGDVNTELLARRGNRQMSATVSWTTFEQAFDNVKADKLPDALAAYLLQQPLGPAQRALVLKRVKPESTHSEQIRSLTAAIMALPEYQLC
ncbi:DUF1800 domain-containing protein [Spirosoma utsteinense]|uniref:DUF1800 domain-containing protein n=1 Tax=Spirosoma utsteinense TaxID=2585773 RepID=A0ABR6WAH3_9BACT|nr:DUF1800 domain-containing protein [Spirosoma utsteinense]MBC3783854.1 putative protein (DUF1800 family) [Spirosoma utsteinense]MBC3793567.1 putative protein (DUF1800 family) [Spirosoma utsteinense]